MRIEPPRRTPENEQKLTVLYCLEKLGKCTDLQILQFLCDYDLANYFEMMFAMNDLCDRGQAVRSYQDGTRCYEVTDAGREALSLFGKRVPQSVKELMERETDAWKERFRREAQNRWRIVKRGKGDYELELSVVEQDTEMMSLRLSLPTRDLAQYMADRWQQKAPEVYGAVFRILSETDEGQKEQA